MIRSTSGRAIALHSRQRASASSTCAATLSTIRVAAWQKSTEPQTCPKPQASSLSKRKKNLRNVIRDFWFTMLVYDGHSGVTVWATGLTYSKSATGDRQALPVMSQTGNIQVTDRPYLSCLRQVRQALPVMSQTGNRQVTRQVTDRPYLSCFSPSQTFAGEHKIRMRNTAGLSWNRIQRSNLTTLYADKQISDN